MKKVICLIMCIVLVASMLCVNVSAATYTCKYCLSTGTVMKICTSEKHPYESMVACTLRNRTFEGIFHQGICNIEQYYCWDYYLCSSCNRVYQGENYHMCYVYHTYTELGVLYRSVCSTYLNRSYGYNLLPTLYECCDAHSHADMVLSGEVMN